MIIVIDIVIENIFGVIAPKRVWFQYRILVSMRPWWETLILRSIWLTRAVQETNRPTRMLQGPFQWNFDGYIPLAFRISIWHGCVVLDIEIYYEQLFENNTHWKIINHTISTCFWIETGAQWQINKISAPLPVDGEQQRHVRCDTSQQVQHFARSNPSIQFCALLYAA